MKPKIFKYKLNVTSTQTIQMPLAANIRSIQPMNGELCLWAEVNPTNPLVDYVFDIYGTGHEIELYDGRKYHGTVIMGPMVWHIFERI